MIVEAEIADIKKRIEQGKRKKQANIESLEFAHFLEKL